MPQIYDQEVIFEFFNIKIAGSNVKAPSPEPNILIATSNPKYCRGTISENIRTKKPEETEKTLIIIALPLKLMVVSRAF